VFRDEAVAAIDAVDRLDEAMTIVSARSAIALAAIALLVLLALAWAVFGTIPVTVTGHGVFVAGAGTAQVSAPDDGTIQTIDTAIGESVQPGDAIARERTSSGDIITMRAPQSGTVVQIVQAATAFVRRGDPVASVAPNGATLRALVFVPVASDRHVVAGMPARVAPVDVSALSGSAVFASVAEVAPYPATAEQIRNALQNDALTAQFSPSEAVREVVLNLQTTAGGALAWSGGASPTPPTGGTPCTVTVVVRDIHPIELIFSRGT
jgi:hypothetical protein